MVYNYSTPENAVLSLEAACTNCDLQGIIDSKDFIAEAFFILNKADKGFDLTDTELIDETAKLLELSMIKWMQENGFPDFSNVQREFESPVFENNMYRMREKLLYPDGTEFVNDIFLSNTNNCWKVIMTDEV